MSEDLQLYIGIIALGSYFIRFYVNWSLVNQERGSNISYLNIFQVNHFKSPMEGFYVMIVIIVHQTRSALKLLWIKPEHNGYKLFSNFLSGIIYLGSLVILLFSKEYGLVY